MQYEPYLMLSRVTWPFACRSCKSLYPANMQILFSGLSSSFIRYLGMFYQFCMASHLFDYNFHLFFFSLSQDWFCSYKFYVKHNNIQLSASFSVSPNMFHRKSIPHFFICKIWSDLRYFSLTNVSVHAKKYRFY